MHQPGQPNSLLAQTVAAVAADAAGNSWVGGTHGLTYVDRKNNTYRHFLHQANDPSTLPGNDVIYLRLLSANVLLVTIWNQGTVLVDTQTGRVRQRLHALGRQQAYVIAPTTGRYVRIVTRLSHSWLLDHQTGQLSPAGRLPGASAALRSLLQTADGTLWGSTFGGGLIEWPRGGGTIRHHYGERKPGRLYDDHITCLFEDRRRQLWVGTLGGLHRYNQRTGQFALLTTDNGLPNDAIMSIGQDWAGFLWVATNDGLCRIDGAGRVVRTYVPVTLILTPLEQFMTDRAPDSRRQQWQTMHQNATRLLRLINQLLDLSKLESDSLRPDISQQDIIQFVRGVAGSFTSQAGQQGVSLTIETEPSAFAAWFDPDIVEKVLYNLIANALKFTPKGGSIAVRCRVLNPNEVLRPAPQRHRWFSGYSTAGGLPRLQRQKRPHLRQQWAVAAPQSGRRPTHHSPSFGQNDFPLAPPGLHVPAG